MYLNYKPECCILCMPVRETIARILNVNFHGSTTHPPPLKGTVLRYLRQHVYQSLSLCMFVALVHYRPRTTNKLTINDPSPRK
jgi:hypothetical protein